MEKFKKTGEYAFFYEGGEQRTPVTEKRRNQGEHSLIRNCTKILSPCFYKESFLGICLDIANKAGSEALKNEQYIQILSKLQKRNDALFAKTLFENS